jgi:hypothetical protein
MTVICYFTKARIVSYDAATVTIREYGKTRVESRFHRTVHPTGSVRIWDRVTAESVGTDVATDAEREAGY